MPMLLDEDYEYLGEIGQRFEENENSRFLILRDFPLPAETYRSEAGPATAVDVLLELPANYNTSGGDMFWVRPYLTKIDGSMIANANPGADPRRNGDEIFERWSRHWLHLGWRAKVDNVRTLVDRVTWAFAFPDARR